MKISFELEVGAESGAVQAALVTQAQTLREAAAFKLMQGDAAAARTSLMYADLSDRLATNVSSLAEQALEASLIATSKDIPEGQKPAPTPPLGDILAPCRDN